MPGVRLNVVRPSRGGRTSNTQRCRLYPAEAAFSGADFLLVPKKKGSIFYAAVPKNHQKFDSGGVARAHQNQWPEGTLAQVLCTGFLDGLSSARCHMHVFQHRHDQRAKRFARTIGAGKDCVKKANFAMDAESGMHPSCAGEQEVWMGLGCCDWRTMIRVLCGWRDETHVAATREMAPFVTENAPLLPTLS